MEAQILANLNPVYSELYLAPLRAEGLRVYSKDLNLDGWIKSIDVFLVYDTPDELSRAKSIIEAIRLE